MMWIGEKNLNSTEEVVKELRKFGILIGFIITGISVVLFINDNDIVMYLFPVGLILLVLGVIFPVMLLPVYRVWMKAGHVVGKVNAFILMSIVFYCMVTPMSVLLRIFSKRKKFSFRRNTRSYWIKRKPENYKETMNRQF